MSVAEADYVGIPFVDGGRDFAGFDCWGGVRLYLQEEAGLVLPSYSETSAEDVLGASGVIEAATESGDWLFVDRAQSRRFDVVQMWCFERVSGRPVKTRRHLGVLVDGRRMLHVEEAIHSVIVPLSHVSVRSRIVAFWRHKDLA